MVSLLRLTLVDPPSADGEVIACTDDLAPRASVGSVPEGMDPTQHVEFIVTVGDFTEDIDLDGNAALAGAPGSQTEYAPSADWFDGEGGGAAHLGIIDLSADRRERRGARRRSHGHSRHR